MSIPEKNPSLIVSSLQQLNSSSGRCPQCQKPVGTDVGYCPHCGSQLASPNPSPPSQAVIDAHPPDTPKSLIPAKLEPSPPNPDKPDPSEKASPQAITLSAESPPNPCVCNCGKKLPEDASYCLDCGAKVGQPRLKRLLVHRTASGNGQTIPIDDHELTIGKSQDCRLVITDDAYVSRRHARIYQTDGMLFLEDMGSANGTFLRPRRPVILETGDEILIGANVFRVEEVQE